MPGSGKIVTSAEFTRHFGQLRLSTSDDPVFITHHGRPTHVLLTARQYERLAAEDDPAGDEALPHIPPTEVLASWIEHGILVIDKAMKIVLANPVGQAMADRTEAELIGRRLYDALPILEGSLTQNYINRAVASGETYSADLPSVFRPGAWVRLEIHPSSRNVTLMFRDITEDVVNHRMADAKRSVFDAIANHPGIGYARLDARGHIVEATESMCRLVHLPPERLVNIAFSDLVLISRRSSFREALNGTLRGEGATRIETELLANDGGVLAADIVINELRGTYGMEGVVVVLTRRSVG